MQEDIYNLFVNKFEPEEKLFKVPKKIITKYSKLLPESIIKLWKKHGFGNYGFGLIKVINPDDYMTYFTMLFNDSNSIPFLIDSFGNIFYLRKNDERVYVWNTEYNYIDLCHYTYDDFMLNIVTDSFIKNFLFKDYFELALVSGIIPDNDEILINNPPISLGGYRTIDTLTKKNTINYLDFLIPILILNGVTNRICDYRC